MKLKTLPIPRSLGKSAYDKSKDPLVIQEGKRTFIAEQFRRMRTSLGYLGGNSGRKKFLLRRHFQEKAKALLRPI